MYTCVYLSVCMKYVNLNSTLQSPERSLDPLEMELQVLVSHPTWVLGRQLGSSGKEASLLNAELCLQPHKNKSYRTVLISGKA